MQHSLNWMCQWTGSQCSCIRRDLLHTAQTPDVSTCTGLIQVVETCWALGVPHDDDDVCMCNRGELMRHAGPSKAESATTADEEIDPRLKNFEPRMIDLVISEVLVWPFTIYGTHILSMVWNINTKIGTIRLCIAHVVEGWWKQSPLSAQPFGTFIAWKAVLNN